MSVMAGPLKDHFDFWTECAIMAVSVVPVCVYRSRPENIDDIRGHENYIGLRYVVMDHCYYFATSTDGEIGFFRGEQVRMHWDPIQALMSVSKDWVPDQKDLGCIL